MSGNSVKVRQASKMSVEESLRYFDDTVAAIDIVKERLLNDRHAYGSESDLLSEIGYASGYTELSATSDGEEQLKQSGNGIRRRKSRQNRNQRFQCDPILGDLESDSTNDGQLFGSSATPRVKTRTNSGQRRKRERRRQRRHNANRNSWTDSGLSLSKTDSQRSSHSENSPTKRGRSKTSPADVDIIENIGIATRSKPTGIAGKEVIVHTDSGVSSPGLSVSSPIQDESCERNALDESRTSVDGGKDKNAGKTSRGSLAYKKASNSNEIVFDTSSKAMNEKPTHGSSIKSSIPAQVRDDYSLLDIKPTNSQGVVNGTYTPKEKEILHQVLENARNAAKINPRDLSQSSKFPLPTNLDYPFYMYRRDRDVKKDRKTGSGLLRGLKKLKQGITSKRNPQIGNNAKILHPANPVNDELPPSRPVDKKRSILKRIFKSSNGNNKKSSNFQRGVFSSSRSFSGSVSQLISRGNRARSQSVENLKNFFRRDGASHIKRSNSSISLAAKMTRSLSVSSLIGRRHGFTRQGSMVSIAGQFSRPSNGAFRRADSVRSLYGGYDIATRMLEPRSMQQPDNCFDHAYFNANHYAPHATNVNAPLRGGWRPSSRMSRREPYGFEYSQCYDDGSVVGYSDFYDEEEPCACCCDDMYNEHGAYCNDVYDYSIDPYYDQRDIYNSRVTLANLDSRYVINPHFARAQSVRSINHLPLRPQSIAASYNSPVNVRRDDRMVVAPLNVKVTEERRAERRQLTRTSRVFDTFV